MCRMIAAPFGVKGETLIEPFVRMARGENALHEHNQSLGKFRHGDGWGVVYAEGGTYHSYRSLKPCWDDPTLEQLRDRTVLLLHARRASRGNVTLENVHPFQHTHNAQTWYFCHNGTIKDHMERSPEMGGDTDSERYFHLLLNHLDESHPVASIDRTLSSLKNYTSLNSFLLNENRFYAINRFSKSPLYYTLHLHQGEEGALLSSEPLLDVALDWNPLTNRTVMIFDRDAGTVRSLAPPTG